MKIIRKGILSGRTGCQNLKEGEIQRARGVSELKGWDQQRASGVLCFKGSMKLLLRITENTGNLGAFWKNQKLT